MLTPDNVFDITREGYALLAGKKRLCGRSLRRFLGRVSANGIVTQAFVEYGAVLSPAELACYEKVANEVLRNSNRYLPGNGMDGTTSVVEMFSLVQNVYRLPLSPTATVTELRAAVSAVLVLSGCMHPFAGSPESALLRYSPESIAAREEAEIVREERLVRVLCTLRN